MTVTARELAENRLTDRVSFSLTEAEYAAIGSFFYSRVMTTRDLRRMVKLLDGEGR